MDIKGTRKVGLVAPLQCWDIFSPNVSLLNRQRSKERDLNQLMSFKEKYGWKVDMTELLSNDYQALVLTNESTHIHWVNRGFQLMTGYSFKEVQNKSPKMLQGKNTSNETKTFIRQHLSTPRTFTTEVVNYKKSGEEYLCSVTIHSLFNHAEKLSHFLALETKID